MGLNFLSDSARLKRIADLLQQADNPALPGAIETINRAIRPAAVLGIFALIGLAFLDPPRYAAGMLALQATPLPVWLCAALVIGLHFLTKSPPATPRT